MSDNGMIGKILDNKYEIIKLVGQGGMASVYKARDLRLGRFVAIKILKNEYIDNEQFLKKFMREAQADAKLAHPNIVNVYDVGTENGVYYLVMEFIDGPTLNDYIKTKKRIEPEETVSMVYSIALGLNHAHNNNIIHRDIKPHNILLTSSKIPKVADFGIARATTSSTLTATEDALGSVHYISPEQARGGFLDERSDLYSLGIMMYQMLTGELPYDGDSPVTVALKHVQNNVEPPQSINKDIPAGVGQVVLNLTRRKPEERYQNVRQLMDDLKKLRENINAEIAPTYSVPKTPGSKSPAVKKPAARRKKRFTRKQRVLMLGLGSLVLAGIIILVIVLATPRTATVPNLTGMTEEEVKQSCEANYLLYETKDESSAEIAEGLVIRQYPEAETEVDRGSSVKVIISTGPRILEIPDVTTMPEIEATKSLEAAGFVVSEVLYEFNDDYKKDIVYQQSPEAGIMAKEGTGITLYVSKGKDTVTVPYLINSTVDSARSALNEQGLILGEISYDTSASVAAGSIIKQSPSAYKDAERNTRVDITVSLGPLQTKNMSINLLTYGLYEDSKDVTVKTKYLDGTREKTVYSGSNACTDTITFEISGVNGVYWELYIGGEKKGSGTEYF